MRIFRIHYKDKDGKKRQARKWYLDFTDNNEIRHRWPGLEDKRATEALGRQIERLISSKVAGEKPDAQLTHWLESVPIGLRKKLVKIGLLDPQRAVAGMQLKKHLEDFKHSLLAKDNTNHYVETMVTRITKIIEGCNFSTWSDISASKTQRFLADLRASENISAQTFNSYLQTMKQFCSWMVQDRRATESPLRHLKGLNVRTDRRHDRQALEPEQIRKLLEATITGPNRYGMTGHERYLLYRFAAETGLRANEIRSLKVDSFDFERLNVTVKAAYSKHRREDVQPLRPETATLLKEFFKDKMPGVKAFGGTYSKLTDRTADMFKADLEVAGIPYIDDAGRYADFHSLRHTTGSLLAASGVHPKVAQAIMRHSDINLTMSRYTHIFAGQTTDAIAQLPDLDLPSKESQQAIATGTDGKSIEGKNYFAKNLANTRRKQKTTVDNNRHVNSDSDIETPVLTGPARIRTSDQWIMSPLL